MKLTYGPMEKGFFAGTYAIHMKFNSTKKYKNLDAWEKEVIKFLKKCEPLKYKNIVIYEPFLDGNYMFFLTKALRQYGYNISLKIDGETLYQWIDDKTWVIVENNSNKKLIINGSELWFEVIDKKTKEPETLPSKVPFHYFAFSKDVKLLHDWMKTSKHFWRILPKVQKISEVI